MRLIINKILTLGQFFKFFLTFKRIKYIPLLTVLLFAALLLLFTKGLSVVAPFVYTLF